ncbi:hypothetical protein GCM10023145_03190 [Angustibacter luteus]
MVGRASRAVVRPDNRLAPSGSVDALHRRSILMQALMPDPDTSTTDQWRVSTRPDADELEFPRAPCHSIDDG